MLNVLGVTRLWDEEEKPGLLFSKRPLYSLNYHDLHLMVYGVTGSYPCITAYIGVIDISQNYRKAVRSI